VESVARCGSLVKAAEELGVSASAVSQQIGRTEAQLGRAIFQRTGAGLELTAFGAEFCARLTTGLQELGRAVALADEAVSNVLVVSVAPAFASRFLVPRLNRFNQRHPEIKLRIDASTGLVDLDHSDVDLAIRMGDGTWPDVRAELLLAQEVFPVCAPALAAKLKEPADLTHLPVIADESTMISWERWFEAAGLAKPFPVQRAGPSFTDPILGIDAAVGGQGVALAWQLLSADALADGRLVAPFGITVASGLGYYLVSSRLGRPGRKVRDFTTWLREEVAATMARFGTRAK
jgi:DNA-binding transcriptional LysR family regulator